MNETDYLASDATSLAKAIKKGKTSAEELLAIACERAEKVNHKINAITHFFPNMADNFLKQLRGDEPFYGVPLVIKELSQAIPGLPLRCGSRLLADNIAQ